MLANLFESADDLPCADFGLLGPLKRSAEYGNVRKRVSDPKPIDAWRIGDENDFVFELQAEDTERAVFALFKMMWDFDSPRLAITVTTHESSQEVEVRQILLSDEIQRISLD